MDKSCGFSKDIVEQLPNLVRVLSSNGSIQFMSAGWKELLERFPRGNFLEIDAATGECKEYPLEQDRSIFESYIALDAGEILATAVVAPATQSLRKQLADAQRFLRLADVGGWWLECTDDTGESWVPVWSDIVKQIHEVPDDYEPDLDSALDFYPEEARAKMQQAVECGIKDGSGWSQMLPLRTYKGNEIWVHAIGIPEYQDGRCVRISGIFQDITERKQAFDQLDLVRERLELATAANSAGVWDYDFQTKALKWDQSMYYIYGRDQKDEVTSYTDWANHLHPEDRELSEKILSQAAEDGSDFNHEFRIVTPSGEVRFVKALATNILDEGGTPLRAVGINVDITKLRKVQDELMAARDRAESANRAKDAFLANISHELRTPLMAISGYAEQVIEQENLSEQGGEFLGTILENSKHLTQLVNDILDLAKITADKIQIKSEPVSMVDVSHTIQQLFSHNALQRKIALNSQVLFPFPSLVMTDSLRIRQVISNLVSNAIKFTPSGSVSLLYQWDSEEKLLSIHVKDTGIGIDESHLEYIFESFSQIDSGLARTVTGTGLGLSICRELVSRLGGSIRVESEKGKGTLFVITLPLEVAAESCLLYSLPEMQPNRGTVSVKTSPSANNSKLGGKVLLVEDGEDNQRLVKLLLERGGMMVVTANNGAEGLALARDGNFDLILMDMQMPIMDGYQATEQIRASGINVPIVALTAHGLEHLVQHCLDVGCSEVLIKPFRRQELIDVCGRYLRLREEQSARKLDEVRAAERASVPTEILETEDDPEVDLLMEKFYEKFRERYSLLTEAFAAEDLQGALAASHQLRSSGLFGFREIGEVAGCIEDCLRASDWSEARLALERLGELGSVLPQ